MKTTEEAKDGGSFFHKRTTNSAEKTQTSEGWVALCAQAAVEQDPKKLLELVSEINRLLDARRTKLASERHAAAEQTIAEHRTAERGKDKDGTK